MNPRTILTRTTMTMTASVTLAALVAMAPTIKRESTAHREALTKLETNPVDSAALASLTDWSHPGTLDASKTQGKVVLLAVVSAADPQSVMTLSTLTRLHEKYLGQGLVVAGIHPDAGFDQVNEQILAGKITIPMARDAGGVFASAMHTDDYPDLYLIDRAGNLRFADLNKRSLKDAVKMLVSETPESAASNAALQAQGVSPELKVTTAAQVDPGLYTSANWPSHNAGRMSADDYQGQMLPVAMGNEEWIANERPLENKVLVLDFWATWCGPCIAAAPMLHKMQNQYEGKLEIVGIGGSESKADFKRYVLKKKGNYAQMFDGNKNISSALGIKGIPHVVVLSTDGIIRWQGNPHDPAFKRAVSMTVAADPVVQANN